MPHTGKKTSLPDSLGGGGHGPTKPEISKRFTQTFAVKGTTPKPCKRATVKKKNLGRKGRDRRVGGRMVLTKRQKAAPAAGCLRDRKGRGWSSKQLNLSGGRREERGRSAMERRPQKKGALPERQKRQTLPRKGGGRGTTHLKLGRRGRRSTVYWEKREGSFAPRREKNNRLRGEY